MASFLYHGSPHHLTRLEPRPARGVGPEHDQLNAVYASPNRQFALTFALPIVADAEGRLGWSMEMVEGRPQISIQAGYLDRTRTGYLYRLPAYSFEPLDEMQWVSYTAVVPIDYEVVDPNMYLDWIK